MSKRGPGRQGKSKADFGRSYRLCPGAEVSTRFTSWGHTRRALHNLLLEDVLLAVSLRKRPDESPELVDELRSHYPWVEDFPRQAANEVVSDLEAAYANWWNPEHPAERPKFEKREARLRFSLPGQAVEVRHIGRKWSEVWVPKAGWVAFRRHRPIGGTVRNATFSYTPGKGWLVSFGVAPEAPAVAPPNGKPGVGADFGVACSAFLSDEDEPRLMPPTMTKGEKQRLVGLERKKARQLTWAKKYNRGRYSHRLRQTIADIAALHARAARRRKDFTHKLTTDMAKNHGWVGIEDLLVKNMTASAKGTVEQPGTNVKQKAGLNRGILDNAPGVRRRQLDYKCRKYGSDLRPVPPAGTSFTCPNHDCGRADPDNRPGCGRQFACVHCGYQAHADWVGAVNVERRASTQGPSGGVSPRQVKKKAKFAAQTAGPADNSTGRRKPSQSRKAEGASVKRVAPTPTRTGRVESRVA